MPDGYYLYCDVSLPVPLDQPFTYALPETLRHRVKPGCRVLVPFGSRRLTGVALRCHDDAPEVPTREALRLIDAEPVLDAELLALGKWISGYYCAPLGEVLRGMLPLASDIRRGKVYSLTDAGRDAARQLLFDSSPEDPVVEILRMLDRRKLSAAYLERKLPLAANALRALERKRFVMVEQVQTERDPLRAPSDRLRGGPRPGPQETGDAARGPRRDQRRRTRARAPHAQPLASRRLRPDRRRHSGARIPHFPAARRHRLRQDRGLPERHRSGTRLWPQRAAAGPGNRPDPRRRRPVLQPLRRSRRHSAQRLQRFRARRSVAPHPLGRGGRGGGHALRGLRAHAQSGPDRSG